MDVDEPAQMSILQPWRIAGARFLLMVRLTPKAAKDRIDGCHADANTGTGAGANTAQTSIGSAILRARVRAIPEKGKANTALEKLIAKWLGLPKSAVHVTAGTKSRVKAVSLDGDHDELVARLTALLKDLD